MNSSQIEIPYFKRFAKWKIIIILLTLALMLVFIFAVAVGPTQIPPLNAYGIIIKQIPLLGNFVGSELSLTEETIVLQVRLPRVLAAAIVGVALAVAGVVLQGLLRNPMADPYVLGISSGAGLGASLAIVFGAGAPFLGLLYSIPIMAFVFAIGTVLLVYLISKRGEGVPMVTLLLVGMAANSFLLAIISVIKLFSGEAVHAIMAWMFGSLATTNWNHIKMSLPFVMIGVTVIYFFARDLNIMLLGEEQAQNLGVDAERLKKITIASATLITAASVSISGIIGFIGLIIPHMARILVGPDHRILIPSSALSGAIVLILCDTIGRMIVRPAELPVGIITSLLGVPFFIYLIRKKKRPISW
jgi:iron complex transport system permease protein